MRILLVNYRLSQPTGTEWITRELAETYRALGHEVAVFCWEAGAMGQAVEACGVPVVTDPAAVPWKPEVIHGNHHFSVMAALAVFPDVPALFHCHGRHPLEEQPPKHPAVRRYLVMAEYLRSWMAAETGVRPEEVVVQPNWVDMQRFSRVRDAPPTPRRAALYAGRSFAENALALIRETLVARGMEVEVIGAAGKHELIQSPETVLPNYDLVLASGRSAMEALACGCAVLPCDGRWVRGFVKPCNLGENVARNFCLAEDDVPLDATALIACLDGYDPAASAAASRLWREQGSLSLAAAGLLRLYAEVVALGPPKVDFHSEREAWVGYFRFLRQHVIGGDEARAALSRTASLASARAERAEAARKEAKTQWSRLEEWFSRRPWRRWMWQRAARKALRAKSGHDSADDP